MIAGCLAVAWPASASAEIFKWVDEFGLVHYTNDFSQVPRKYRVSRNFEKKRSVGPPPSAQKAKTEDAGEEGKKNSSGETGSAILTEEETSLVKEVQAFFSFQEDFVEEHAANSFRPTGWRIFLNAMQSFMAKQEALIEKLGEPQAPVLQEALGQLEKSLAASQATPVGLRRMSVASTLERLKNETAANAAISEKLSQALEESEKQKSAADAAASK